jgi:hypothetical protein
MPLGVSAAAARAAQQAITANAERAAVSEAVLASRALAGFSGGALLAGLALYAGYELYQWASAVAASGGDYDLSGWQVNCGGKGGRVGPPATTGTVCNPGNTIQWDLADDGKFQRVVFSPTRYVDYCTAVAAPSPFWLGFGYVQGQATGSFERETLGQAATAGKYPIPLAPVIPAVAPYWDAPARPLVSPMVDPLSLPINKPVVETEPLPFRSLPYRLPNRWRSPTEQTQRGPEAQRKPRPRDWDAPRVPRVEVSSGGDVVISPPTDHEFKRPGPKSKERKIRISTGGTLLRIVFDHLTEIDDFVDAFWWALPKGDRTKVKQVPKSKRYYGVKYETPKLPQKLKDLYDHWNDVDMNKAIDNLVQNEIGDRAAAKIGKASGHAAAATGRPVGYQLGPVF